MPIGSGSPCRSRVEIYIIWWLYATVVPDWIGDRTPEMDMATWMETFSHYIARSAAPGIQKSVSGNQACTQKFSQCEDPFRSWINQRSDTAGGVCDALSSYWIVFHARKSTYVPLWTWLAPNGKPDYDRVTSIIKLQAAAQDDSNPNCMINWLKIFKILPLQKQISVNNTVKNVPMRAKGTTGLFSCSDLADKIAEDYTNGKGQYKKIGIYGKAGGHSMAAFVDHQVLFFDPNFGEFFFPSAKSFVSWMTNSFWYKSFYWAGLSGKFEIEVLSS